MRPTTSFVCGLGSNSEYYLCFLAYRGGSKYNDVATQQASDPASEYISRPHRYTHFTCWEQYRLKACGLVFPSSAPSLVLADGATAAAVDEQEEETFEDTSGINRIVKVVAGSRTSFLIDDQGNCWACGYNGDGSRGRTGAWSPRTTSFVKRLRRIRFPAPEEGTGPTPPVKIVDVVSYTHTIFLTEDGRDCYVAGDNELGSCGLYQPSCIYEPYRLRFSPTEKSPESRIIMAAVGFKSTFFVTDHNEILACGNNNSAQLGLGHRGQHVRSPKNIHFERYSTDRIVKIKAGDYHVSWLTENGEVWQCGNVDFDAPEYLLPSRVPMERFLDPGDKVIDVDSGCYFRVFLVYKPNGSREVFFSGSNSMVQIGGHGTTDPIPTPRRVNELAPLCRNIVPKSIHAGHMSFLIRGVDDRMFLFGNLRDSFYEVLLETPAHVGQFVTTLSADGLSLGRDHMLALLEGYSCMDVDEMTRCAHDGVFTDSSLVIGAEAKIGDEEMQDYDSASLP